MRWSLPLLLGAIAAFLLGAVLVLLALERQALILAVAAILSMIASMVLFVLSIWLPRARVDWERIQAEQKLWESGPLGRSWLRTRRRLYQLWKI